jgi:hypothetical protein
MPRPMQYPEKMLTRFPPETFGRIAAVLKPEEDQASFVRQAALRELERRERLEEKREASKPAAKSRKRAQV